MSHTLLRSKADKRSLGPYAKPLMQLVEAVADGKKEEGIAIADEIQQELRVDLILAESEPQRRKAGSAHREMKTIEQKKTK